MIARRECTYKNRRTEDRGAIVKFNLREQINLDFSCDVLSRRICKVQLFSTVVRIDINRFRGATEKRTAKAAVSAYAKYVYDCFWKKRMRDFRFLDFDGLAIIENSIFQWTWSDFDILNIYERKRGFNQQFWSQIF